MKKATIKPADRLGLSLFLATVVHAMIILGVGFTANISAPVRHPSVDVVMVHAESVVEPDEAQRIAQANQLQSGSSDIKNNPTSPVTGKVWADTSGISPVRQQKRSVAQSEASQSLLTTQTKSGHKVYTAPSSEKQDQRKTRDSQSLDERNLELAKLVAELARDERDYNERPRKHFIDTQSAKSAIEAAYLKQWVDKVERVGNLNYPDEARRQQLSGILILNVLINNDGSILDVSISSKSGYQVLDDAAVRIAELASPYPRFPAEMREEYDQLMITRSWIFEAGNRLSTR